ncbi:MAG: DUF2470 domain-containing protein [Myxococcota bacterium]|nr:DUF2470 domain-containing protein [Myxococcota bacterium]
MSATNNMLSNITPDREARAFARTHAFGVIELKVEGGMEAFPISIAFSPRGQVLLGDEMPLEIEGLAAARLHFQNEARDPLLIQGLIGGHRHRSDQARFRAVHQHSILRWKLEPDVVLWHSPADEPHAFLESEWLLPRACPYQDESEMIDHLNQGHGDTLARLLVHYQGIHTLRPRVLAIDPEGMLFATHDNLAHVAFAARAYTADDIQLAIMHLVNELPEPMEHPVQ